MSGRRALLEDNLVGEKIRRFKTFGSHGKRTEVRVSFVGDDKTYWLLPLHGHYFESVWVNTGKSHDEITRVSQEFIHPTMYRVKLHCHTHVLSMFDIKREDGNTPSTYALEVHEEY